MRRGSSILLILFIPVAVGACAGGTRSPAPTTTQSATSMTAMPQPTLPTAVPTLSPEHPAHAPVGPRTLIVQAGHATIAIDTLTDDVRPIAAVPAFLQFSFDSYHSFYAASPDGTRFVYACAADGSTGAMVEKRQLCIASADGGARVLVRQSDLARPGVVTSGWTGLRTPAQWSPTGGAFAFHIRPDGAQQDAYPNDIYVYDIAAGRVREIVHNGGHEPYGPVLWAPDGRHLAVQRLFEGGPASDLFVIDTATGSTMNVVEQFGAGIFVITPVWSPDGTSIAFIVGADNAERGAALYVWTTAGAPLRKIAEEPRGAPALAWSTDAQWIAAVIGTLNLADLSADVPHVYALRVDGTERREVAIVHSSLLAWSRDGRFIAAGSGSFGGGTRVYDLAGAVRRIDADVGGYPQFLAWTPDDQGILYTTGGCGQGGCTPGNLYRVGVDGSSVPVQLYRGAIDRILSWR